MPSCFACPKRYSLLDLKNRKKHDQVIRNLLLTTTILVFITSDENRSVTFHDISEDVKKKFPHWKSDHIVVPSYNFAGLPDRIIWTKEDMTYSLKKTYEDLMGKCTRLIQHSLRMSKEEAVILLSSEVKMIFPKINQKEIKIFKEKASRIFEENDANSLPTSLNDFFNKQINWYVCKYEKKTLGCFQNIKGARAESFVRAKNLETLRNGPGAIISNLSVNFHLKEMLKNFGIPTEQEITVLSDVECDSLQIKPHANGITVVFEQVKSFDMKRWNGSESFEPDLLRKIILNSMDQLVKDVRVFNDIFCFLLPEELAKIDISTVCSLPNIDAQPNFLCSECRPLIKFKEDFNTSSTVENLEKTFVPEESLQLYLKLLSVFVGLGSMVKQKAIHEGYNKERNDLFKAANNMEDVFKDNQKIIMLGPEQISLQYQRFNALQMDNNVCLVGPYGSGKTVGLMLHFDRIVKSMQKSKDKIQIIIIVWEDKAQDLKQYYKKVCIVHNQNISVKVFSRSEAFDHFGKDENLNFFDATTTEINSLCQMITEKSIEYLKSFLIIDEVTVEHNGQDILGNVPIILDNLKIVEWSNLKPDKINLCMAITPMMEVGFLRGAKNYSAEEVLNNNVKTSVKTVFLPRVYRMNQECHEFLKFLEIQCIEKVFQRFAFHPSQEVRGHEIIGEKPKWICVKATEHVICKNKCRQCFLNTNLVRIITELIEKIEVPQDDVTIIIDETILSRKKHSIIQDKSRKALVRSWFDQIGLESVNIKYDQQFEGMDSPTVIVLQNTSDQHGTFGALPTAISRVSSRLIMISPKGNKILEEAASRNLVNTTDKIGDTDDSLYGSNESLDHWENLFYSSFKDFESSENSRLTSPSSFSDFSPITPASDHDVHDHSSMSPVLKLRLPNLTKRKANEEDIDVSEFWISMETGRDEQ